MIRTDVLHTDPATLTDDAKDSMLRIVNMLADEFNLAGVNLIDFALASFNGHPDKKPYMYDLFYELFDREAEEADDEFFKKLLVALREHAGEPDDDMYND